MKYTAFHASQFQAQVQTALESVERILDVNRNPRIAEDVEHKYDDKFALAEFLTNTTIAAQMNVLERMGVSDQVLSRLCNMVKVDQRAVTICFQSEDTCTFQKEHFADVVSYDTEYKMETTKTTSGSIFGSSTSTSSQNVQHKVIKKAPGYHWKVSVTYRIFCYAGNDPDKDFVDLLSRTASTTIVTTGSKQAPFPERQVHSPFTTGFSWILKNIKESEKQRICSFKIDRSKDTCRTPRRNEDIEASLAFFKSLSKGFTSVRGFFTDYVEGNILGAHRPANPPPMTQASPMLYAISDLELFCPTIPLFEPTSQELPGTASRQEIPKSLLVFASPSSDGSGSSPLLSIGDIDKFLNEQCRTLDEVMASLTATFPSHQLMKLATVAEASLVFFSLGSKTLQRHYELSIEYLEDMLRKQLIAAIGKTVGPKEFHQFMQFHCSKFMTQQYAPKPFSYAIRRPDHYPDGILSIESNSMGDKVEPVNTHVRHIAGADAPAICIPINSATSVQMTGDRFLHGWINHRFESFGNGSYTLSARARQFSSFMILVGVVAGPDKFIPKDAIILQNKDEVLIPLLLNELPSAKEFKDAIASLSPEQQRFATAFRGMQLESSVFGVCVIQLKPQLEALLGLPPDALTKEIRLTQDLMSLFVEYQIPSDLLSFDGSADASLKDKVNCVKAHAQAVLDVIADAKKTQLEERQQLAKHNKALLEEQQQDLNDSMESGGGDISDYTDVPRRRQHGLQYRTGMRASRSQPQPVMYSGQSGSFSYGVQACAMAAPPSTPLVAASSTVSQPIVATKAHDSSREHASMSTSARPNVGSEVSLASTSQPGVLDFTMIPKRLDSIFERFDTDSGIRATILEAGRAWKRLRQENLLSKLKESSLNEDECKSEKDKAFDLLDAISRSGALPIAFAELHVIVAVTHCFENDVMGTVIQDNINPIEKVEKSIMMVASTIQGVEPKQLISDGPHLQRLMGSMGGLVESLEQLEN